jgi:hypothetical protein
MDKKRFKSFFPLWDRIKAWFWWHFMATDIEKAEIDYGMYGNAVMKNGKRIFQTDCNITDEDRKKGVDVEDLIKKPNRHY